MAMLKFELIHNRIKIKIGGRKTADGFVLAFPPRLATMATQRKP